MSSSATPDLRHESTNLQLPHTLVVTEFPADVEAHYRGLAARRQRPSETAAAFLASVVWYRELDEGSDPRHYYEYVDHEGLVGEGARWLWEAVAVNHEVVAIKQIELPSSGVARRYWWRYMEEDAGGLTDQPLEVAEPGLASISRSVFYAQWDSSVDS